MPRLERWDPRPQCALDEEIRAAAEVESANFTLLCAGILIANTKADQPQGKHATPDPES